MKEVRSSSKEKPTILTTSTAILVGEYYLFDFERKFIYFAIQWNASRNVKPLASEM